MENQCRQPGPHRCQLEPHPVCSQRDAVKALGLRTVEYNSRGEQQTWVQCPPPLKVEGHGEAWRKELFHVKELNYVILARGLKNVHQFFNTPPFKR